MSLFPSRKNARVATPGKRQRHTRSLLPGSIILLALSFFLIRMLGDAPSVEARGFRTMTVRGLIVQVDSSNAQDITFSILDNQSNSSTIHLVPSTRFLPTGSTTAQLAINTPVIVRARATYDGSVYAQQVQVQPATQAPLTVRGVVASINKNNRYMTLALSDGTMIQASVPARSRLQTGAYIALRGHLTSGVLQTNGLRILKSHVRSFQARVVIGHTNTRAHRLTLITPAGTTFSITQRLGRTDTNSALAVGVKASIGISIDNQGNLNQQRFNIENNDTANFTLNGIVSALDTTNGTFTLIDEVGDVTTIKADATLLQQVQIGNYYSVDVSPDTDGSLTAVDMTTDTVDSQDSPITLDGTIQSYDTTSGLLGLASDDGTSFTLHVNDQTMINNEVSDSNTLAIGQVIEVQAQLSTDQGYTALEVDIQDDPGQGDVVTLSGNLQNYDPSSGQLTVATTDSQTITCATSGATQLVGTQSLSNVTYGARLLIQATVQTDGSYSATSITVMGNYSDHSNTHHHRSR